MLKVFRGRLAMTSSELLAELSRNREKRVLSIQSHVVHGYAGNKCAVFPLQLHGFDVDFVNSVQFSNHAGNISFFDSTRSYAHVKGQRLTDSELADLYEGLQLNNLNEYSYILTGYCGNVTFLRKIGDVVKDIKKKSNVRFVCDPVMGDNGRYYTPKELLPVYKDEILPLADVLTPNAFELSELVGFQVETEEDCFRATEILHQKGIKVIVVTSGVTKAQTDTTLCCFASVHDDTTVKKYRFTFPRLEGQFVGTGDVFTSLLIATLDDLDGDVAGAVPRVLGSMQALIKNTFEYAKANSDEQSKRMCELRLIQTRKDLLVPPNTDMVQVEQL